MAQHYGLPTRLLDWSYSPLVAAHFATEDTDAYDRDGAIWCIDATEVKKRLPKRLRKRLEEANCNIFSLGLLEEEVRDFAEMQALSPEPYALFFEPASMLDRIANQYALFPWSATRPCCSPTYSNSRRSTITRSSSPAK